MSTLSSSVQAAANARLLQLAADLASVPGVAEAAEKLRAGHEIEFSGVVGSATAVLAAFLEGECSSTLVVVDSQQDRVDLFAEDLALFSETRPSRLPAWESARDERKLYDEIYSDRLSTLKQFAHSETPPQLLVTCIQSLMQPVPALEAIRESTRVLRVGDRIAQQSLAQWFAEHGYHSTSAVELPGEFSMRGGILDVFAADAEKPVRIEWFDDEIESIRQFEIATQTSDVRLEQVELTMLGAGISDTCSFVDYLPSDAWILLLDPHQIEEHAVHFAQRLDDPSEIFGHHEILNQLSRRAVASCSSVGSGNPEACHLPFESVERFSGEIGKVRDELDAAGNDYDVFVVAPTDAEIQRLSEILGTSKLASRGHVHYPRGDLNEGFKLVPQQTLVISGNELFRRGHLRRLPRRRLGKAIDSFLDLETGDLVVHLSHGIARYRGLKKLEKDGQTEEHLELEFHGGTRVYVPATKIDLVQKYVGGARSRPTLARLGGKTWVRQKQAASAAVRDLAADMIEMQAERVMRPGIAFERDSEWQREFDASFPYQETPDQLESINAIKADMEVSRPMDRLLCGDVGFGKTEIAMRAAFKAIESGYQVAILVPTTILAEQHYQTFSQRMAEFPIDVARLSRFCSSREQKEITQGLEAGRIDVVVGTHRLASKDVKFFNLGLVIIDEEQRFGVEVKERLKTLRSTVDVLTMTATPIPRTLHMSLVGVRDISNLESPPEDRMSIETRVTRFNDELIRHAVLREISRGGQVFFVHNRVEDIEQLAFRLQHMVPEASIVIGHGQMPESKLEQVMLDFVQHRFDVLLATTIVESGLDIPNANTIFIDEAHRYGLADLHQLRGRVGRYKHRAYCYLLVDPGKHLSPNASKRLRAIEEFSDLGAGFALAMRDLEIRGAGNLLGTQQSGHISAVGYELYCQLLESAVRQMKKLPPKPSVDVDVDLPGEAFVPDEYVPEMRMKIDLYRRLNRVISIDDLNLLTSEMKDRFGAPPPPVLRMIALAELRIDAAIWQISSIFREGQYLVFRYANSARIEHLCRVSRMPLRVVDQASAYLTIPRAKGAEQDLLALAKSVLQTS